MTELSTYGARAHEADALRVTRCCSLTEELYVLRPLMMDVLGGLALEALYHGRGGGFRVRNDNRVVACSGLCYA